MATTLVSKFYTLTDILIGLADRNRITAGAVRYYSMMENNDVGRMEMWIKRQNVDRIPTTRWEELIDKVTTAYNMGVEFANEQINLPFEETQKQVAIRKGTHKSSDKIYIHKIPWEEVDNATREDDPDQCH